MVKKTPEPTLISPAHAHAGPSQRWRRIAMVLSIVAWLVVAVAWREAFINAGTFGLVSAAIAAALAWIQQQRIRATEQRLVAALRERDGIKRDLDDTQAQLQTMQRQRTQLLAGIGQDLRQPLQAVRQHADAMLAAQPDSPQAAALRQQLRAADDAIGALDQFAGYADIERGALTSSLRRVNVRDVIESVAAAQRSAHAGESISIHTHGRDAWVRTDPAQLRRIVHALMAQAVRQSLRAEQPRHSLVVAAVRPHGAGHCIDIVDNGDGIEREQLDRVFEPYEPRSADASNTGDRGLSLAVVPGLARQLGMRLAPVRSRRGRGTRFRVVLPGALRWRDGESTTENAPLAGRLLAVLDDDDRARQVLVSALQSAGADCVEAPSLTVMRHRLQSELRFPDALVFDLETRRAPDGIQAIERLRDEWQLKVPALLVAEPSDPRPTLPPACVLVEKPVSAQAVVQALGQVMAPGA
jgi:signal transduction histidine kinase/CheY-like chemotaxis protein